MSPRIMLLSFIIPITKRDQLMDNFSDFVFVILLRIADHNATFPKQQQTILYTEVLCH